MSPRPARVLVVQHTAVCPPGLVGTWLGGAGLQLDVVACHRREALPDDLTGHDALLVLGGEMGAYDDDRAPWLPAVRGLLAEAVADEVPTLAICLGHQLLAVAAGGRVERSTAGQQGSVLEVGLTDAAAGDRLLGGLGDRPAGLHWNNDLVTGLPPGAVELARSAAGVQAFRVARAWGVQWHPEATTAIVGDWARQDVAGGGLDEGTATAWVDSLGHRTADVERTGRALTRHFATVITENDRDD